MQTIKKENARLRLIPEVRQEQHNFSTISMTGMIVTSSETISISRNKGELFDEINLHLSCLKEELHTIHDNPDTNFDANKVILETEKFLRKLIEIRRFIRNSDDIIPDMMALDDGGIGLEWRPKNGIITVSMYGDGNVNLVILSDNYRYDISSKFPLSDDVVLHNKLTILNHIVDKEKASRNDIYLKQRDSNEIYLSTTPAIFNEEQYGSFQGFHAKEIPKRL